VGGPAAQQCGDTPDELPEHALAEALQRLPEASNRWMTAWEPDGQRQHQQTHVISTITSTDTIARSAPATTTSHQLQQTTQNRSDVKTTTQTPAL
jgi:hypothetical protein